LLVIACVFPPHPPVQGIVRYVVAFWMIYNGVWARERVGLGFEVADLKRFLEMDGVENVAKAADLKRFREMDGVENVAKPWGERRI